MKLFQMSKALMLSAFLSIPAGIVSAQFTAEAEFSKTGGGAHVYATAMQADGKVVAVGTFDTIESTTRNNIARLTTTGALDTGFNPNANGQVNHALVQDDDKVLIVGSFTTVGGISRDGLARLNADGTLDTSFAPSFDNAVSSAALQTDGKIVVAGTFTSVNSTTRNRIARLNSDGSLDSGFDPDANAAVNFVTIRSDGKIMASGSFTAIGGGSRSIMARLASNGSLDTTYTHSGSLPITSCPLFGSDGSMCYVTSTGPFCVVEEVDNDGANLDTIVNGHPSETFPSFVGSRSMLALSFSDHVFYYGLGLSAYYVANTSQISQLAHGGVLYARDISGNSKVGQHNVSATQTLKYLGGTTLQWAQTVNFPAFESTKFQVSTDGGSTWSDWGAGSLVSATQIELTGITLPGSGLIRAVSVVKGGAGGASRSLVSSKVVTITPEVDVVGNNQPILDGDTTPTVTDHTYFSTRAVSNGSWIRNFGIRNPGAVALTVSSITIGGSHPGDFSVSSVPGTVAAQGGAGFVVTFDPTALGTRTATVIIASDDPDESSFEFDVQGTGVEPEINVKGNSISIVDGDNTPSAADHTDFGSLRPGQSLMRTFTIENTGSTALTISTISPSGFPNYFSVSGISLPTTVAVSSSTTFNLTFNAGVAPGTPIAQSINISCDDGDEANYNFSLKGVVVEPEINLTGNSVNIVDGDATPSTADHTDFGSPSMGGSVVRTFTIQNTGTGDLNLSAINVTGHTADFTVGDISLPAAIAGSGSTTFTVTYLPTVSGSRSATVTLVNDDANEASYDFAIQGTSAPEINVQGGGINIVDGDTTPLLSDETNFGVAVYSLEQVVSTFYIQNVGSGPLTVTAIGKSGTHNADYSISGLSLPATVASGAYASFNVTFAPSALGTRTATITITNSDGDESSYDFAVQGSGVNAGDLDGGFNPNSNSNINAVAVQPDGKIIVAGTFTTMGGVSMDRVARLNADGTLDTTFADPNVTAEVSCVAVQQDGKILIGGLFISIDGTTRNRIARLNADGSLDTTYDPNSSGVVYGIALQSNGDAIVTGQFITIDGVTRNRVARLDSTGAATSFNPNASSWVYGAITQDDGKVILYGIFTTVGGVTRNRLARVDSTGALDTGYNPNINSNVNCAVLQPDGKLLIGGTFTAVGGVSGYSYLARIDSSGSSDTSFTGDANAEVHTLALQTDGKIFAGGHLTNLSGTARDYVGRMNANGTLDSAFVNPDGNSYVYGAMLQADGKLLLGGLFTTMDGGTARSRLARIENNVATETLSVTSSSRIEWLRGGASPEATFVTFEKSTDGGSTWTLEGVGTRISGGWELTGLTLPGSGKIRARAVVVGARKNASRGIVENIVNF